MVFCKMSKKLLVLICFRLKCYQNQWKTTKAIKNNKQTLKTIGTQLKHWFSANGGGNNLWILTPTQKTIKNIIFLSKTIKS